MSKGRCTFRKRDLRVARELAQEGDTVEVRRDGTITLIPGKRHELSDDGDKAANECDEVLDGTAETKIRQ